MDKYLLSDEAFLDALTEKAKASERLRMHYDLRDSAEEQSMRMLNALEPGTVIPIHRHNDTSEEVICIRGCVEEVLYDDSGEETARLRLSPRSGVIHCRVPMGQFHTCQSLESGSVIIEFKAGKYNPRTTEDIFDPAASTKPTESSERFENCLGDLKKNIEYLIGMERHSGSMEVITPLYVSRMLNVPLADVEAAMKDMDL